MTSGGWHQFPRGGVGHSHASRARETREGSARFKRRKIHNKHGGARLSSVYAFLSYFVRSLPTRVYLMYSTATAYAGDRNENKEGDSRRHKGCFASKRKIQSIRNLVTAKKERTQVKENLPEEEKDCEPPRKIKRGHNR